jgi:ADP-heptose:LPS heptosyltransferase
LKILLVRLRQIGDVVLTTPSIAALRHHYSDAHLTYVVEPAAAPVVAHNPHLNEVIVAPLSRGLAGLAADVRLGRHLRRGSYDVAIDFHGGPRASLLTWLSAAPMRIGYSISGRSWMYTRVVPRPRELRRRHSVENQWDLLEALDVPRPTRESEPLEMPIDAAAADSVRRRLSQAGVGGGDETLIVAHVSASSPFRRWPLASFIETLASLAAGRAPAGRRIVVTSGPSDVNAAREVINGVRARLGPDLRDRVIEAGEFSLAELRALLERSALYIGGDSGPLHIAATTRVGIVALFGPTPAERSAPWRSGALATELIEIDGLPCRPCDQRVCEPGDFRCLTRIDAPRVTAAAERVLARVRYSMVFDDEHSDSRDI